MTTTALEPARATRRLIVIARAREARQREERRRLTLRRLQRAC